jgi:hypothetical protein
MSTKTLKTIVKFRKGSESQFNPEYIPLRGEVVFVEFANDINKMKIGDGVTKFADLPYADKYLIDQINSIVIRGYYIDGEFYTDEQKSSKYVPYEYKLYIDIPSNLIYSYDGTSYVTSGNIVGPATETNPGIMKLYNTTGNNTDGTMTQNSITSEIGKKFVVTPDEDETITFTNN